MNKTTSLDNPYKTSSSDTIHSTKSELPIRESIDTPLTEVKFDNKSSTLEIFEEIEDSIVSFEHLENELPSSNSPEDKDQTTKIFSVKENDGLEVIESKADSDKIVEQLTRQLQIYGKL